MGKKKPLSHFSPVLANKYWEAGEGYLSYFYCPYRKAVHTEPKGRRQWGRKRGLYTWDVENSLDNDLETKVGPIYEKILSFCELSVDERYLWSQFLTSQLVRTPTFLRYETEVCKKLGITEKPDHDRVGCLECGDLHYIARRDWIYLIAHKDDYFVRSDNPVLQSGFIERQKTCLFYPLTPKVCFVACSMPDEWDPFSSHPKETGGYELEKGVAHMINFHLARAANESLIINPKHDGIIAEKMFSDILGIYPQPPFSLYSPHSSECEEAYNSINRIMSWVDGVDYPSWLPFELEPFYRDRKKHV